MSGIRIGIVIRVGIISSFGQVKAGFRGWMLMNLVLVGILFYITLELIFGGQVFSLLALKVRQGVGSKSLVSPSRGGH